MSVTVNRDTFDPEPIVGASVGTITITYPQRPGETTPGTLAGPGSVSGYSRGSLQNGQVIQDTVTLVFEAAPTWTPST